MEKNNLEALIQKEIQKVTAEYLRDLKSKHQVKNTDDYLNSNNMSEEEFDANFFFGGTKPDKIEKKYGPITIKENTSTGLRITTGEIKEFENSFKRILDNIPGASIVFDKQRNGYTLSATKKPDGIEANASGVLNLGDNGKIIWTYSILNGLNLNAQNLKLEENNKLVFEALFNHYNDWQKKWRENLNLPNANNDEAAAEQDGGQAPDLGPAPTGGAMPNPGDAGSNAPAGGGLPLA